MRRLLEGGAYWRKYGKQVVSRGSTLFSFGIAEFDENFDGIAESTTMDVLYYEKKGNPRVEKSKS